jgi:putative transcriptional regulator
MGAPQIFENLIQAKRLHSLSAPAPRIQVKGADMAIIINLDVMLAKRKVKSRDLAEFVGITEQNLSLIKTGKVKGVRLATLNAICEYLQCQPGDILEYREDET